MNTSNSILAAGATLAIGLTGICRSVAATPPFLLAHYRFQGNSIDATGNSEPMYLRNTTFINNTLYLNANGTNRYEAKALIPALSYNSFTVALDFNPISTSPWGQTILYGGDLYRWIGFDEAGGCLRLTLNNSNLRYSFPDTVLETNKWHTLFCSVDLVTQKVITVVDGIVQRTIELQNFQFNIIGSDYEELGKNFTFINGGNASAFCGFADNLRVYNRALTEAEIAALFPPPLSIVRSDPVVLIHWSVDLTDYVLQMTAELSSSNRWIPVMDKPIVLGSQKIVVKPMSDPCRFYRLWRP